MKAAGREPSGDVVSLADVEHARFRVTRCWPKAFAHRSLGHRPRKCGQDTCRLAKGHIHSSSRAALLLIRRGVNMAFSQCDS